MNSEVLAPTPRELGLGTPDAHSAGAAIADEALMAELEIPAERREAVHELLVQDIDATALEKKKGKQEKNEKPVSEMTEAEKKEKFMPNWI